MTFPQQLQDALSAGLWPSPGPEALIDILGLEEGESDLVLFDSREMMEQVNGDIDAGGYVDDPEFCMVRSRHDLTDPTDPRLVYADALFIGGAKFPGDDVLLAIDTSKPERDQEVLWFDWSRPSPGRWKALMRVAVLLDRLAKLVEKGEGA